MLFKINEKLLKDFPGVKVGVILATGIKNGNEKEAYELFRKQQDKIKNGFLNREVKEHQHIAVWREAYKKFGAKPKEHLSSVENLATRSTKSELRSINTLVDLYNYISLKYLLPAGGEDIDKMVGDLELTYATANEKPIILLGEKEVKVPKEGEVIYKDSNGTVVRRWNWKEADRTKLTENSVNALLSLELLPPVKDEILEKALNELAILVKKYCGGNVTVAILDENKNSITLKNNSTFADLNKLKQIDTSFEIFDEVQVAKEEQEPSVLHSAEVSDFAKTSVGNQEHQIRVQKVKDLEAQNVSAWPILKNDVTATAKQAAEEFKNDFEKSYQVAGRIVSLRLHGKTAFANLLDKSGKIQIYFKEDIIGDKNFEFLKHFIDLGDIIWIKGSTFRTKTGEITIKVEDFTLLSKCLHPLPEKFHGLTDVEIRYRQRYLDLISNPESRERFLKRSNIVAVIRHFMEEHGYVEVETPMLHPIPGGAAAKPFITHHNALDDDFYLRIAPELYLKRLVIGGIERVFEINRNFRNEGVSTRHNPEFTMLEFYTAYKDYKWAMNFVEELLQSVAKKINSNLQLPYGERVIDFTKFDRLNVKDAILKYSDLKENQISEINIDKTIKDLKIELRNKKASYGEKLFTLFEEVAESKIVQPTFLIDFPIEVSPLAKRDPNNPEIASRFELFIAGMEIANGFTELNDPFDQAQRFLQQLTAREFGDEEAHHFDQDYITALEYALPPTVGVGIGIDRLVMLMTNTTSIRDVILFPTLKKK